MLLLSDTGSIINYFRKIISRELGLEVQLELEKPQKTHPQQINFSSQEHSTTATNAIKQVTQPAEVSDHIVSTQKQIFDINAIKQTIKEMISEELKSFRTQILQIIDSLNQRITRIEEILSKGKAPTKTTTVEQNFIPTYTSLQTSDIELLLHEAKELIGSNSVDLIRLIRLEAVEWQLIKASSRDDTKDKVPQDLLRSLRLEINRLRKILLQ